MNPYDEVKLEAIGLGIGDSTNVPCFFCKTDKNKLSIKRTEDGILYHCWRAACTAQGMIGSVSINKDDIPKDTSTFLPNPYTAFTELVSNKLLDVIENRYELHKIDVCDQGFRCRGDTLIMPLISRNGVIYGHTTKSFATTQNFSKAVHWIGIDKPLLHYPYVAGNPITSKTTIVLVEDVLSAIKITDAMLDVRGVALLGTALSDLKVKDLLKSGARNIIMALDPDAQYKMADFRKKYGIYFDNFSMIMCSKDPKDLSREYLTNMLKQVYA